MFKKRLQNNIRATNNSSKIPDGENQMTMHGHIIGTSMRKLTGQLVSQETDQNHIFKIII